MEKEMPVPSVVGMLANLKGQIKKPSSKGRMPYGGERTYSPKWTFGVVARASKNARHCFRNLCYKNKSFKVHRLVCEAYHGPPPFLRAVVLHLNENALDNRPQNLRWGTQKENLNMPKFIVYCKSRTGENSAVTKGKRKKARKN